MFNGTYTAMHGHGPTFETHSMDPWRKAEVELAASGRPSGTALALGRGMDMDAWTGCMYPVSLSGAEQQVKAKARSSGARSDTVRRIR